MYCEGDDLLAHANIMCTYKTVVVTKAQCGWHEGCDCHWCTFNFTILQLYELLMHKCSCLLFSDTKWFIVSAKRNVYPRIHTLCCTFIIWWGWGAVPHFKHLLSHSRVVCVTVCFHVFCVVQTSKLCRAQAWNCMIRSNKPGEKPQTRASSATHSSISGRVSASKK